MKPIVKNWIVSVSAVLILAGMVTGIVLAHTQPVREQCTGLRFSIEDQEKRSFITERELNELLRSKNLYPVGQALTQVRTRDIEKEILAHPMVRTAECYLTNLGECMVTLTQRVPAYQVVTASEAYWVDMDRCVMPIRKNADVELLLATGNIGSRMATHELYDLIKWLKEDPYWTSMIGRIEISDRQHVQLVRQDGKRILLGSLADYTEKLNKFRRVDEDGFSQVGMPECKEIDLRFAHQVVTR